MNPFNKSNLSAFLTLFASVASTSAFANTCTDAVCKEIAGYYMIEDSGLQLDSAISPNFYNQTYTYSNGKVSRSQFFEKDL